MKEDALCRATRSARGTRSTGVGVGLGEEIATAAKVAMAATISWKLRIVDVVVG